MATVRASSPVRVLRLHRSVFDALARAHPEVRQAFEALARGRALWNFFRIHSGFAALPDDALARSSPGSSGSRRRPGSSSIREGDPPGADVRRRGGSPSRRSRSEDGADARPRLPAQGRLLRRAVAASATSRARQASRRSSTARCSVCPSELFRQLLAEHPEFRARMRGASPSSTTTTRLARVPLDFADEILPAEARARRAASRPLPEPLAGAGRRRRARRRRTRRRRRRRRPPLPAPLPARRDGLRRRVPRRWSAATSAAPSRSRTSARSRTRRRDGTTLTGITARRGGARPRGAVDPRLEEPARRAAAARRSCTGRATTGSSSIASIATRCASPTRSAGSAACPARGVPRELDRLCVGDRLRRAPRSSSRSRGRASLAEAVPAAAPPARRRSRQRSRSSRPGLELVLPILTQVVVDRVLPRHGTSACSGSCWARSQPCCSR